MREFFLDNTGKASMSTLLMFCSFLVSSTVILMMAYNKTVIDAATMVAYLGPYAFNSVGKAFVKTDTGQ